jgi:hypothetical protein
MKSIEVPFASSDSTPSARTFRRKGNTYVIKNSGSNEDVEDIYHVIDELYAETNSMAIWADWKANIYKFIFIFSSIYIIVAGAVVGVLGIGNRVVSNISNSTTIEEYSPTNIAVIVLGFSITVLKSLLDVFTIQKRSFLLKQSGIKLRKIARDVKSLKNLQLSNLELFRRIDEFYMEIDELDIKMFNNEDLTTKKEGAVNTTPSQSTLTTQPSNDTVIKMT